MEEYEFRGMTLIKEYDSEVNGGCKRCVLYSNPIIYHRCSDDLFMPKGTLPDCLTEKIHFIEKPESNG